MRAPTWWSPVPEGSVQFFSDLAPDILATMDYSLHHFLEYFQTSAHIQWILFVSTYKIYRFLSFFHFFIPSLILALFKSSHPEKKMNNSLQYSDTIILNRMRSTTTCNKLFSVIC